MKFEGYRYWRHRESGEVASRNRSRQQEIRRGDPDSDLYTPVVVLDPDDREQMEALTTTYVDSASGDGWFDGLEPHIQTSIVDRMTAAVRSLLPVPPKVKPEEPNEWGSLVRDGGVLWLRIARGGTSWRTEDGVWRHWPDFSDDVEIIRVGTGVES